MFIIELSTFSPKTLFHIFVRRYAVVTQRTYETVKIFKIALLRFFIACLLSQFFGKLPV